MANGARQESSGLVQGMEEANTLDTVFLEFWSPGDSVTDKSAATKVPTYTCCMKSFAAAGFIGGEITAEKVPILALESFFSLFGLPKLILVEDDTIFKGFFLQLFESLGILVKAVLKENHRAVRNEIFHKYLNKVQVLHASDKASVAQWRLGTSFATYSWNAAPVDGTDIERAIVDIGRSFPFPTDITQAQPLPEARGR